MSGASSNEIIQLQIGGCGNRIGSEYWSHLVNEHKIDPRTRRYTGEDANIDLSLIESVFVSNSFGCYRPRCFMVDVKGSADMDLALKNSLIDSVIPMNMRIGLVASTSICETVDVNLDPLMEAIRWETEASDMPSGFKLIHSLDGGFSSQCVPLLMDELRRVYEKKMIVNAAVLTESDSGSVDFVNFRTLASLDGLRKNSDACILYENEALGAIWRERMNIEDTESFEDFNGLIASHLSGISASYRLPGQRNRGLAQLVRTIIPLKGMNFLTPSLAPMFGMNSCSFLRGDLLELTNHLFNQNNMMILATPAATKQKKVRWSAHLFGTGCVFRGPKMSVFEARKQVERFLVRNPGLVYEDAFVDSYAHPKIRRSAAAISCSSLVANPLQRLVKSCMTDEGKTVDKFLQGKSDEEILQFREQFSNIQEIIQLFQQVPETPKPEPNAVKTESATPTEEKTVFG